MTIKIDWDRVFKQPAVICAWCGRTLKAGTEPASHGICNECLIPAMASAAIHDAIRNTPTTVCARCNHVHYNDAQRARCSAREDV